MSVAQVPVLILKKLALIALYLFGPSVLACETCITRTTVKLVAFVSFSDAFPMQEERRPLLISIRKDAFTIVGNVSGPLGIIFGAHPLGSYNTNTFKAEIMN